MLVLAVGGLAWLARGALRRRQRQASPKMPTKV
jgi:hypothetical protein